MLRDEKCLVLQHLFIHLFIYFDQWNQSKYWGFPTREVYLHYISCLRYTILVGYPRYVYSVQTAIIVSTFHYNMIWHSFWNKCLSVFQDNCIHYFSIVMMHVKMMNSNFCALCNIHVPVNSLNRIIDSMDDKDHIDSGQLKHTFRIRDSTITMGGETSCLLQALRTLFVQLCICCAYPYFLSFKVWCELCSLPFLHLWLKIKLWFVCCIFNF